jgi:IclR family transcriptional regulator, KDG regulon repressor
LFTPGTSPTAEKGPNVYSVPAIHRTLDIIEALIKLRTITVSEVNQQFKIPKSSAYAILQTLKARGYVHKDEQDRYSLSLKLFSLGSELIAGIDLRKSTYSLLKELADKAQITAHIGLLEGNRSVYIEKIEVMASIRLRTEVGRTLPLHSTAIGKSLLAFRPEEEIDRILSTLPMPALTPKTITDPELLKKELARIRAQGYSVGNGENEIDTCAVGAPIFGSGGHIIAAVNLGATSLQMRPKDIPRLGALVREYGLKMSERLGYHPSSHSRVL